MDCPALQVSAACIFSTLSAICQVYKTKKAASDEAFTSSKDSDLTNMLKNSMDAIRFLNAICWFSYEMFQLSGGTLKCHKLKLAAEIKSGKSDSVTPVLLSSVRLLHAGPRLIILSDHHYVLVMVPSVMVPCDGPHSDGPL